MPTFDSRENHTVTAAITTYKRPELVKRAILSVVNQTHRPLEIIVIEDGPATQLESWCKAIEDVQLQYIAIGTNKGLAGARNVALDKASGKWLAYLDDDDEWLPTRLEQQVAALEAISIEDQHKIGVVYCGSVDPATGKRPEKRKLPAESGPLKKVIATHGLHTLSSTFMFKVASLKAVEGFDETLQSSIDHDIWMALAVAGYSVLSVPDILVVTHGDPNRRMIFDGERRLRGIKEFLNKWRPTFVQWWGTDTTNTFIHHYFARIGAFVVAEAVMQGRLLHALRLFGSIVTQSGRDCLYAIYIVLRRCSGAALERLTGYNKPRWIASSTDIR